MMDKLLNEAEKLAKWESFRDGPSFGRHNWIALDIFSRNLPILVHSVELNGVLFKRLESGDIRHSFDSHTILRLKQHIILDSIIRIQTIIEALLVIVHGLSRRRQNIARLLTHYDSDLPKEAAKNLRRGKYPLQTVLALPNITAFPLNNDEKRVLTMLFCENERIVGQKLVELADFYERYRIVYGKSKHGLTIYSGSGLNTGERVPDFNGSLMFFLDYKRESDMPEGYLTTNISDPLVEKWFNAQAALTFGDSLTQDINKALSILTEIGAYIVENHMTFAKNCGQGYLPYTSIDADHFRIQLLSDRTLTPEEQELWNSVQKKIRPLMNTVNTQLFIQRNVDQTLLDALLKGPVTNFRVVPRTAS